MSTSWPVNRLQSVFLNAVGIFLIAAAVLKGHQLAYYGVPAVSLVTSVPLHVLLVITEFLFGIWLMTGLYGKLTRLLAIGLFFGLLQAALWLAFTGQRSCGCLGRVDVNPWIAVGFDLLILAALAFLRDSGVERTIRTHSLRFSGFVFASLAFGVPGLMTMSVYQCETSKVFSRELRHDRLLHNAKITVGPQQPTARDLVALVAEKTGAEFRVDESVRSHFEDCQPEWKAIDNRPQRSWAALEAVSRRMPVPSRWIRTKGGYTLIVDDPLHRATSCWICGLALGVAGFCWVAWKSSQPSSTADRSTIIASVPVGNTSR